MKMIMIEARISAPYVRCLLLAAMAVFVTADSSASPTLKISGRWSWGGTPLPRLIPEGELLYIHQGGIRRNGQCLFVREGASPVLISGGSIVLTVRLEKFCSASELTAKILDLARRWKAQGNEIWGVQVDFDSPTFGLDKYAVYLGQLRAHLPQHWKLSVTGLADWAANAPEESLAKVMSVSDEIIFQLYEGTRPIPQLERYLVRVSRLDFPFKIGVLESTDLAHQVFSPIIENPFFRGFVYFPLK